MNLGIGFGLGSRRTGGTLDPATLNLGAWWSAPYSGSPWPGRASAGSSGSYAMAHASAAPAVGAPVNGRTPADFVPNDLLQSPATFAQVAHASHYSVAFLVYVDAIDGNAGTFADAALLSTDGSNIWAITLRADGTVSAIHFNVGGNAIATASIITAGWSLVKVRYDGTSLQVGVDSTWGTAVAASDVVDTALTVQMGTTESETKFLNGRVLECLITPDVWTDETFAALQASFEATHAIALTPAVRVASEPFDATTPPNGHAYVLEELAGDADYVRRDGGGLEYLDGKYWILGGWNPNYAPWIDGAQRVTNEVLSCDPVASPALTAWTERLAHDTASPATGPTARWRPRHWVPRPKREGRIYVVGSDHDSVKDLWRCEEDDPTIWERLAEFMPITAVVQQQAAWFRDELHVMGGADYTSGGRVLRQHLAWNGSSWRRLPDMPTPRAGTVAVEHDDHLLLIGGHTNTLGSIVYANDSWAFDGERWARQSASAIWTARRWLFPVSYDGKLWVTTGSSAGGNDGGCYYSEDLAKTWQELASAPWPGSHADGCVVTDGGILLATGNNLGVRRFRLRAA